MMRAAAVFMAGVACAGAARAEIPRHIDAEYQITAAGLKIAQVVESFSREGERYTIQSVTRAEGALKLFHDDTITFHSEGSFGPGGLKPQRFSHRQARDTTRDIEATFDWPRGMLVSTFRGETKEIALPAETQDRLSIMYQFMNLTPGSGPMAVAMSNGRKVERYQYRFVDESRITTPAGTFDTVHYARVNEDPKESRADVWLARDRFNYPVRVVFDDPRGLKLEQSIVSLQAR